MSRYQAKEKRLELARNIAAESIILLKNENSLLPLKKETETALFGRAQLETMIAGSGSGAMHSKAALNILDECIRVGIKIIPEVEGFYREEYEKVKQEVPFNDFSMENYGELVNSGLIYEIFGKYEAPKKEFVVSQELLQTAGKQTDTAIYVLGRSSGGEECDRRVEDDYYLLEEEKALINSICKTFSKVILIVNSNGAIDLSWAKAEEAIQSILYIGAPGEQGAAAVAEILIGEVTPSGKLAFTLANTYEDYPTAKHFSFHKDKPETILEYKDYGLDAAENGSIGFEKSPVTVYAEDIYVGYRYFDSFTKTVTYPFGYGLSYADFTVANFKANKHESLIEVTATVTNTSEIFSGKEVVQLYISAPSGKIERPYQEYLTSVKTNKLGPGASQVVKLTFPVEELACYNEESASYVIEEGKYYIRVGNSSRNTVIAAVIQVNEEVLTAIYENRLSLNEANKGKISFLSAKGVSAVDTGTNTSSIPVVTVDQNDVTVRKSFNKNWEAVEAKEPSTLNDVKAGKVSIEQFLSQMSIEELAVLVNGYGPGLPFGGMGGKYPNTIHYEDGTPIAISSHKSGNMGYVSPALPKYNIPSAFYKDGPAGVGMTAWPTGMAIACSFNLELMYQFGDACGYEAESLDVDSWLTPGLNLHRNPICGRNFEYFSEDPRVAGYCGIAIMKGVQENHQVTTCPKHFALNEQETYRRGSTKKNFDAVDTIVTERAARELYLKPFEMVVRNTNVRTFMTSFNKINGVFAGGNYDLCTAILRYEWGFNGVVVTDWGDMDIVVDGADAVAAGNDVVMPGGPPVIEQVLKGYKQGRVTRVELEKAVANLLFFVMKTLDKHDQ